MMRDLKESVLGKIPTDWNIDTIEALSDKVTIGLVKTMTTHYTEVGIPLIRNSNIKENWINRDTMVYLTESFSNENKNKQLKAGDIVTVHTGDIGTSAVIPEELDGSQGFATLNTSINKSVIHNEYLSWFFNSSHYKKQAYSLSTGDGRNNLNLKDFKKSVVCYPSSLTEQQKIAAILSSVDEAIEKTDQIIKQTETVKKGLMQELLTKGIGHTEFKDSPIGKIPREWTMTFIKDISTVNPEQLNSKTNEDFEINYIDISAIENHEITATSTHYFKDAPGRARRIIKTDDILVSTVRPYLKGFTYIKESHNNFICSTGFSVIRCREKCISSYLYHVILSDKFIDYLISNMTGSSFPAVKADDVKNYHFPLPSLNEQLEIANILNGYQRSISLEREKTTKLKEIKQGLMQQILTGKVRVKVNDIGEVAT